MTETRNFAVGDHIFQWCSYLGVPFAYQQHAIVVAVRNQNDNRGNNNDQDSNSDAGGNEEDEEDGTIVIMNFDHEQKKQEEEDLESSKASSVTTATSTTPTSTSNLSTDNDDDKEATEQDTTTCTATSTRTTQPPPPTITSNSSSDCDNGDQEVTQQDTTTSISMSTSTSTSTTQPPRPCCKITQQWLSEKEAKAQWEHVQYSQKWQTRLMLRAGTCSPEVADPVHVILCRLQFLLHNDNNNNNILQNLPYHTHKSNGECLAVWCTTGTYQSAQGIAKMGEAGMHVGSFSLVGGIAAQLAVSAVVPVILPFVAALDVGQAVYSAKEVHTTRQEWQERTIEWNQLFEQYIIVQQQSIRQQEQQQEQQEIEPQEE